MVEYTLDLGDLGEHEAEIHVGYPAHTRMYKLYSITIELNETTVELMPLLSDTQKEEILRYWVNNRDQDESDTAYERDRDLNR